MVDKFCPVVFVTYHIFIVWSGIGKSGTQGGSRIMISLQLRNNSLFTSMEDFCCVKSLHAGSSLPSRHMLFSGLSFADMPFTKL